MSEDDNKALADMGFSELRIKKAFINTNNSGFQSALDWLIEHNDDKDIDEPIQHNENEVAVPVAKSMKCDDCGKLLRDANAIEFHAAKTNHSNFSESTEEIKPLTEEERKQQLLEIQEILRIKREKREQEEKDYQRQKEIQRREEAKGLREVKEKFKDLERQKEMEQQRREKMEDKQHRELIKQRIAKERLEQKLNASGGGSGVVSPQNTAQTSAASQPISSPSATTYNKCRLQIRLTNGKNLSPHEFDAESTLSAVKEYIDQNRSDGNTPYQMRTTFPVRQFGDDDMNKSLMTLGLCPSSVILIQKKEF